MFVARINKLQGDCAMKAFVSFLKNTGGNVALMVGLAAVPLFGVAGIAVDYSNSLRQQADLAAAVDSAALAAASLQTTSDSLRVKAAQDFFSENYPHTNASLSVEVGQDSVRVNATDNVNATISKVFGLDDLNISAMAEASIQGTMKAEILSCADASGSVTA